MKLVQAEIREFRSRIHQAENRLIAGMDKARDRADRADRGDNGPGLAYAQRPPKDWRGVLAMRIGGMATPGGRYLNATYWKGEPCHFSSRP